jgi:hypothetical protein
MVTGKPKLDREYWNEPDNDVTKLFPSDSHTYMINVILGHCVVEREERCLSSADDLLLMVTLILRALSSAVNSYMMESREFAMCAESVVIRDQTSPRIFRVTT